MTYDNIAWIRPARAIVLFATAFLLVAPPALAASIAINPVTNSVNGNAGRNIGDIAANLNGNTMDATFTLNAANAFLLDCYEFQWLQVVTSTVASPTNPKYNGQVLQMPIIDTPNGGYDGMAGEDNLPWYLTAADITNNNLNGTNPNGSKFFNTNDTPSVTGATFDTWIVAYEPGADEFCVIAGFEWGSGTTGGAATLLKKNGTGVPNAANIATINTALTNGGFNGWTAEMNCNLVCVPEPGSVTIAVLASLMALAIGWRRRRLAA